ncbi:MAG TPA: ABC transporter ATP-binding protein [Olsenella sp.]|nr:ABC transporter ATP-binding protein [Olsenella sp.]
MKSTMSAAARDYVRAFYRDNRLNLSAALVLTVLDVPAALIGSWLLGRIIDVIGTGDVSALARLAVFCAAFLAASLAVSLGMYRAKCAFIYRALAQYKSLAFERLSEKGVRAFARENTGSYLSLLTNDVASIEEGYLKRGFLIVYHALLLAGSLAMMLALSVPLTVVAVALSAAPLAVSVAMGREMGEREQAVSAGNERFVSRLRDLLAGFSVVKAFRAEAEARQLFDAANSEVEGLKRRRYWWECLIGAVSENLCGSFLQFGVFLAGAWLAVTGEVTAGTVLVFVNLCNYLVMPINVLPQFLASRRAAAGLIEKLAEAAEKNEARRGEKVGRDLAGVVLDHVGFAYDGGEPVLSDVSLALAPGGRYALVGASGSGKSTLLNLLMGGEDGYTGSIRVGGHELRDVDAGSLCDLMGLIDQQVFLFDDTLGNNVTMFRDFPESEVLDACRRAGLGELVAEKGLGYECGEGGANLSGGERQRVSIARALLRKTPVLLVDEATSALDARTASEVAGAILDLEGPMRLVVTHRLEPALLARYDEIFVLREGHVVERGIYAELASAGGYFAGLCAVAG